MPTSLNERLNSKHTLIEIGPLDFAGPFISHLSLKESSGILATLVRSSFDYELLNVYSTANLRASALLELSYHKDQNMEIAIAGYYCGNVSAEVSTALASLVWKTFN